jgi:hypothetical protein
MSKGDSESMYPRSALSLILRLKNERKCGARVYPQCNGIDRWVSSDVFRAAIRVVTKAQVPSQLHHTTSIDGQTTVHVFLTSWSTNAWELDFRPEEHKEYILPDLNIQPTPSSHRNLIIRRPEISPLDSFSFFSQIGSVYYAMWKQESVTVMFLSKEHTDQCFDEVVGKGYDAMITVVRALFDRELR